MFKGYEWEMRLEMETKSRFVLIFVVIIKSAEEICAYGMLNNGYTKIF